MLPESEYDGHLLRLVAELYFIGKDPSRKLNYAELLKELRAAGYKINEKKIDDLVRAAGRRLLFIERDVQAERPKDFLEEIDYKRRNKEGWGLTHVIVADPTREDFGLDCDQRATCRAAAGFYNSLVDHARVRDDEIHILIGGGMTILNSLVRCGSRPYERLYLYSSAMVPRCSPNSRPLASPVGPEANVIAAWLNAGRDSRNAYYATTSLPEVTRPEPNDDPRRRHLSNCSIILEHTKHISQEPQYASFLRKCAKADVAFMAFGILEDRKPDIVFKDSRTVATTLASWGINPDYLFLDGAVGTLDYCILNEDGACPPYWQFFLNAGYPDAPSLYRNMVASGDIVVGIGNFESVGAIIAALRAKLINVLITDRETAKYVTTLGFHKTAREYLERAPNQPED